MEDQDAAGFLTGASSYHFSRARSGSTGHVQQQCTSDGAPADDPRRGRLARSVICLYPQQFDGSAVVCLVLSGELDLDSAPTFRAHLAVAHDADGFLLDFHDLRYIDSSGVNVLLIAHQSLAPSGRRIALVGLSPNLRRILSVLHLEDLIPVFVSLDEALGYLRTGKS